MSVSVYCIFGGPNQGVYSSWDIVKRLLAEHSCGPKCTKKFTSSGAAHAALDRYNSIREADDNLIHLKLQDLGIYSRGGKDKRKGNVSELVVNVVQKVYSDGVTLSTNMNMSRCDLNKLLGRTDMSIVLDDGECVLLKYNTVYADVKITAIDPEYPECKIKRCLRKKKADGDLERLSWCEVDKMLCSGSYDAEYQYEDMIIL